MADWCSPARADDPGSAHPMRELLIIVIHLLVSFAKLLRPGGVRAVAAESLLLKHPLLISNRSRHRAPNLTTLDRVVLGLTTLFVDEGAQNRGRWRFGAPYRNQDGELRRHYCFPLRMAMAASPTVLRTLHYAPSSFPALRTSFDSIQMIAPKRPSPVVKPSIAIMFTSPSASFFRCSANAPGRSFP